jgi:hypothetical protein
MHTFPEMRNVGMIEVVNEPARGLGGQTDFMRQSYYNNVTNVSTAVVASKVIPADKFVKR